MDPADLALDALGNRTRRGVLNLLAAGPLPVGALAQPLGVSRPAISQQLRVLEAARLVRFEARGASNLYQLDGEGLSLARGWLDTLWPLALDRFSALAEQSWDPLGPGDPSQRGPR